MRENNFLLVGYTLSFLLLSNDASVVPRPEREKRRLTCVNPLERFLAISENRILATLAAAPESQRLHIPLHAGVSAAEYDYESIDRRCKMRVSLVKKRQPSIASLFMQQLHSRLLLNGIILRRAQQFLSSSSIWTNILTKILTLYHR